MPAIITAITPGSPAARTCAAAGDALLAINGYAIEDVLDYRFYAAERRLRLLLRRPDGKEYTIRLRKQEYDDLGLCFEDGLMDGQRQCKNKCIFCFIDQLPRGLRPSLYVKDDDARLSFLFGNYITLTNLTEREVRRIIDMRLSPVNVSVHTMDSTLRVKMMRNPRAGESLAWLEEFTRAGIDLNVQLVLCPGLNDGEALRFSLERLLALPGGRVRSVAAVPVGLTKHRDGLEPLRPFIREEAVAVIDCIDDFRAQAAAMGLETELCPSDEFFLLAERAIPGADYYGAFAQLENGVGLWALLRQEILDFFADAEALASLLVRVPANTKRIATLVTGRAAAPLLRFAVDECAKVWHNVEVRVIAVENRFFGGHITVAGLLTGQDICAQLQDTALGDEVLLPAACLRHERDLTLDGMTLPEIAGRLGVPCRAVENNAQALIAALLGQTNDEQVG